MNRRTFLATAGLASAAALVPLQAVEAEFEARVETLLVYTNFCDLFRMLPRNHASMDAIPGVFVQQVWLKRMLGHDNLWDLTVQGIALPCLPLELGKRVGPLPLTVMMIETNEISLITCYRAHGFASLRSMSPIPHISPDLTSIYLHTDSDEKYFSFRFGGFPLSHVYSANDGALLAS